MKKCITLLCLVSLIILNQCKNDNSTQTREKIKNVENSLMGWVQTQDTVKWSLEERMKFYNIPGLSIAVIDNYKIDWAKGYGWADSEDQKPVTEKTLFQAASISKSLNAIGMLKLVQDQMVDLDADINKYLTSWHFPYDSITGENKITVTNLLSHTAGLNVHGFPGYEASEKLPLLKDILDGAKPSNTPAIRSQFEPGVRFQYSGGGVTISQQIVTDVTKQSYDSWMWENVLKPLGMSSSSFSQPPSDTKKDLLASGYHADGKKVKGKFHIYPEEAAAGLWTNPSDLCKYIIETQLSYQGKSEKVLSTELTKLRLTPFIDASSALGVFIDKRGDTRYFQHTGGNDGFTCQYYGSLDEGKGVVIMTNSDNGSILEEIVNSVAYAYKWKNFYNPVMKNVVEISDSVLSTYTGQYSLNGEVISCTKENEKLILNFRGMKWPVFFTSPNDFFVFEYKADMKFVNDSNGMVNGITLFGNILAPKIN
jgi:CubicO group peptidase (beta-lactamase class C family)